MLERKLGPVDLKLISDRGYGNGQYVFTTIRAPVTDADRELNHLLSAIRTPVEWSFHKVHQLWPAIGSFTMNRILRQSVGSWYLIAALLTNCHTCLHGSETGDYFECLPLTLAEYLDG